MLLPARSLASNPNTTILFSMFSHVLPAQRGLDLIFFVSIQREEFSSQETVREIFEEASDSAQKPVRI